MEEDLYEDVCFDNPDAEPVDVYSLVNDVEDIEEEEDLSEFFTPEEIKSLLNQRV